MSPKTLVAIVIILVVVAAALLYYILYLKDQSNQQPTVSLAKQQVTSKESAEKVSSDIKSVAIDIKKELGDIQNSLP